MCSSCDVLQASYLSANAMTNTFCDYGSGSMGEGIRKFAKEMIDSGVKEGYKIGCSDGYSIGFIEGSVITTVVLSVIGLSALGIKKISDKHKSKKEQKSLRLEDESLEKEVDCSAEV
ncbi:MAG: hypothetical protein IJA02_00020 [Clostridia bacterium]|nr:hypothetical protein [Clostridia bacterium]